MSIRAFTTSAKAFAIHRFRYGDFQFVWRDKIHQQLEGDNALKDATRNEQAVIAGKQISEFQFRGTGHSSEDPEHHWTLYCLVDGIIKFSAHVYRGGRLGWWYTVKAEEAAAKALSAEEMVPVEAKVDAKVGEAGGESSKAGEGETSKTAEGSGKGVA